MANAIERFNEREANPNKQINFITPLSRFENHEEARIILRAIAAQFEPIMRKYVPTISNFNHLALLMRMILGWD